MHFLALGVSYDGGSFNGWQSQSHAPSVQSALEAALSAVADTAIQVNAAGRTDSGVHATGQVVSFATPVQRPDKAWLMGTNSHLPDGVRVRWVRSVAPTFHARYSALTRRYLYLCQQGSADALSDNRVHFTQPLDDSAMHQAAQYLVGEMDYSTFRASGCQSHSPFRRVHHARVHRFGPLVAIDVEANAFLLRMMRNIAGALVDVGLGSMSSAEFAAALATKSRTAIGKTAPPQALYLVGVRYPTEPSFDPLPLGELPPALAHLGTLDRL